MSSSPIPLGRTILYLTVGLIVQTLVFGAYTVIIFLSTRMLMKRGLKTKANRNLLVITLFMYLLSGAYFVYRTMDLCSRIEFFVQNPQTLQAVSTPITHLLALFNALTYINYTLCDGVIIWRARLICSQGHRKYLYLPLFFLTLTTLAVVGLIGLRILSTVGISFRFSPAFTEAINILQVAAFITSVISNLSSTGVVGITAWFVFWPFGPVTDMVGLARQHRTAIRDGFNRTTKGDQILRILLESGVLYSLVGSFGIASLLIKLPYNTLGDLYTPVNFQMAGVYTPIVLLLVSMQKSLHETSFLGTILDDVNPTSQIHVSNENRTGPRRETIQIGTEQNNKDHGHHPSEETLV
ncbi:hypothetical protein K438DRAFT_1946745 [Mycena galopus ATCC 62051]|nr:hypothetical protein K438DRAFT_1946745 [Mycena galopus ATCC 62051]